MVVNQNGGRGEPIVSNPPHTIPDIQAVSDYAAAHGALMAGTNTDRLSLEQEELFDGLHFYETDTRSTWLYSASDSGWIAAGTARRTATSGVFTPSDGWAVTANNSQSLRVMRDTNWIYASFTRTGTAISVTDPGDIKNVTVGRLAIPPTFTTPFSSGLSGRLAAFVAETSGLVQLAAIAPGSTIATGASLSFGGPYPYL